MTTVYCCQFTLSNIDLKDDVHNIWFIPVFTVDRQFLHEVCGEHGSGMNHHAPAMGHTVTVLDTILFLSFLKMPVVHNEMEQRRLSFIVTPFPCFLLASMIYCRFYYMLKYDFNANFKASPLQLQSLAVNNRRGKLNSQQLSRFPSHKTNCKTIWSNNKRRTDPSGQGADMAFRSVMCAWKWNMVKKHWRRQVTGIAGASRNETIPNKSVDVAFTTTMAGFLSVRVTDHQNILFYWTYVKPTGRTGRPDSGRNVTLEKPLKEYFCV